MGNFVHLHLHSEYSLLDGACRIRDIPAAVKAAGQNAVAITDHGVMYGAVNFYKACRDAGVRPIIGCEMYVSRRSRFDRDKDFDAGNNHLILLVENETGYRNLIKLVSAAFSEGFYYRPRIDTQLLLEHTEGLICLSACLAGFIPRAIVAGEYEKAEAYALRLDAAFGRGNFYLELQDHGLRDDPVVNEGIRRISEKTGIPMVATNDVHYLKKTDAEHQAVLMCIQTGSVISDGRPLGFERDEFYLKTAEEMEELFRDYPDACANTVRIAERCRYDFEFGHLQLPRYTPENGLAPGEFLRKLAFDGLAEKTAEGRIVFDSEHPRSLYEERIKYELSVIDQMGYSEYYLIVWDFVSHAKSTGIPVGPGRGSGAGSIVAFLIGITDIDPIRFDLLFERFLNPERVSMPDFDIDFSDDRRDEAIAYVRQKYGDDHTAQIVTFGTLAARAAVRDVGRALGMSIHDVDTVAREIPQTLKITLAQAIEQNHNLKDMMDRDPAVRRLIESASALEGMPRHASTHAAGVVITERPVTDYVPTAVNGGVTVTQFTMDDIAELGLLKFDFLALRYLTIIRHAEEEIRAREPGFDLTRVDPDDRATYDSISAGRCDGVFQLESSGMRQMLTQLKPHCIDDIIAAIALYRPGPMDSIPKYLEAREHPEKIVYCTPLLKPILDVTYGCIVYQEQVMQIFREVAGYSFGHADVVRRAISKKKQGVLESERQSFLEGAAEHGVSEDDAVSLFEDIVSFANYAFNKSHAAAYAVISFRTAYLKTHYPVEYESALLTTVQSYTEKLAEYFSDCQKQGIRILPPDINRSYSSFHVEGKAIRFGLTAIKGIGEALVEALVRIREEDGEYRSFDDFIDRIGGTNLNKRQLETLIKAGALDSLGVPRSRLLAVYESVLANSASSAGSTLEGQIGMFESAPEGAAPVRRVIEYPNIPELSAREKLALEKESTGLYLSGHILDDYKKQEESFSPVRILDIVAPYRSGEDEAEEFEPEERSGYQDRDIVTLVGVVTRRVNKSTRDDKPMAFVTIEDRTASIEVICFSSILQQHTVFLVRDAVVAVTGRLSIRTDEEPKLIAESMTELIPDAKAAERQMPPAAAKREETPKEIRTVFLRVPNETSPEYTRTSALCGIFPGKATVVFYTVDGKEYLPEKLTLSPTPFVLNEIREILGEDNVVIRT